MEPQLEAILILVRELSLVLGDSWDDTPQNEIKQRISNAIALAMERLVQ